MSCWVGCFVHFQRLLHDTKDWIASCVACFRSHQICFRQKLLKALCLSEACLTHCQHCMQATHVYSCVQSCKQAPQHHTPTMHSCQRPAAREQRVQCCRSQQMCAHGPHLINQTTLPAATNYGRVAVQQPTHTTCTVQQRPCHTTLYGHFPAVQPEFALSSCIYNLVHAM
jgi:hypothetical protein